LNGVRWRLHYCERCDHRFPTIQRVPTIDDFEAADAAIADTIVAQMTPSIERCHN